MRSASLLFAPTDINGFKGALKHLGAYAADYPLPNGLNVYMFEKYFFQNGATMGGVFILEPIDEGTYSIHVWALGGGTGLANSDMGAEKKFVQSLINLAERHASELLGSPIYDQWGRYEIDKRLTRAETDKRSKLRRLARDFEKDLA